ncbi:hypothetical protein EGI22_16595 [Lacihabitans sp. LS3-19]|uniref:hypothetical protein n=1 Tax=Lacihabitans sp. LS3-19 TaxID=2487335 RepID=UPI0020CD57C8|nr:hypothetical protein [Lacihabitans sp. LS3-19]MCP9769523.1 hypothetical protein [Lacihabitans sp. LS3-19]
MILIIGGIASYFGPWWIIAPVALALCWWKAKTPKEAYLTASAATVTLWIGYATFLNATADVNLIDKIAELFTGGVGFLAKVPKIAFVFTIMTLIATAIGGFAGMSGVQMRRYFK